MKRSFFLSLNKFAIVTSLLIIVANPINSLAQNNLSATLNPKLNLGKTVSGEEAILELGSDLEKVAKFYRLAPDTLRSALRQDPTLKIRKNGVLYFQDSFDITQIDQELGTSQKLVSPESFGNNTLDTVKINAASAITTTEVFNLHSLPGSKKVIYLDFKGGVITGTGWNADLGGAPITVPAWSLDADPLSYNSTEVTGIHNMWKRVAEDYAPFDIDVTTQDPGEDALTRSSLADEYYGMRVTIGAAGAIIEPGGSSSGMAYTVGFFNQVGNFNKPVFVFSDRIPTFNERLYAEIISHEVGHSLGLLHDGLTTQAGTPWEGNYYSGHGSGATSWAPIMGNPFSKSVTQWSRSEYPNANNTQDELAVINSFGVNFRNDDHGDTAVTSTTIPMTATFTSQGIVNFFTDKDVFKFETQAGTITLTATPNNLGPNLDILIELYDSNGNLITTANPSSRLDASISTTVAAGTYYLHVQGTGFGTLASGYSNYGSIGNFTVTGTLVQKRELTVFKPSNGTGTVVGKIGSTTVVSCGTDCSESANYNSVISLTATKGSDSNFTGWSGACTGTATTCSISMDTAKSVSANFVLKTFTLTVNKSGTGTGLVTGTLGGASVINCGSDCTEIANINSVITLTPTPSTSDMVFAGWTGACTGTGACSVTMTGAKTVGAMFNYKTNAITATKSGTGTGVVTGKIGTSTVINCGSDCSENAPIISVINFTAAPTKATSVFTGWSGACTGTGACSVTADAAKSVNAEFRLKTFSLTVSKSGTGTGSVLGTLGAATVINCGLDCSETVDVNSIITLTPTPVANSSFTNWTGACTGTGACSVTMTAAKSVGAVFTLNP